MSVLQRKGPLSTAVDANSGPGFFGGVVRGQPELVGQIVHDIHILEY